MKVVRQSDLVGVVGISIRDSVENILDNGVFTCHSRDYSSMTGSDVLVVIIGGLNLFGRQRRAFSHDLAFNLSFVGMLGSTNVFLRAGSNFSLSNTIGLKVGKLVGTEFGRVLHDEPVDTFITRGLGEGTSVTVEGESVALFSVEHTMHVELGGFRVIDTSQTDQTGHVILCAPRLSVVPLVNVNGLEERVFAAGSELDGQNTIFASLIFTMNVHFSHDFLYLCSSLSNGMLSSADLEGELEDVVLLFSFRSHVVEGSEISEELRLPNHDAVSDGVTVA